MAVDNDQNVYIVEDRNGGVDDDIWFARDWNKDGVCNDRTIEITIEGHNRSHDDKDRDHPWFVSGASLNGPTVPVAGVDDLALQCCDEHADSRSPFSGAGPIRERRLHLRARRGARA